jgi:NADPH-ferrihemoprotein reductase
VQERAALAAKGKSVGETVLFFGCQKRDEHFLYQDELEEFGSTEYGTLHVAFSRDNPRKKVYVQHLLEDSGAEVYAMLKAGGHLYVCGDAKHMARDVNHTLVRIAEQEGGFTNQQAVNWVKDLRLRKRYSEDVWA